MYFFCRYFKGDIQIASVDGYGTDVYVYLQSLSHMAQVCRYLSTIYDVHLISTQHLTCCRRTCQSITPCLAQGYRPWPPRFGFYLINKH